MKLNLKVPCSVDMSVINAQMAVVDQKKAELKKAIDALANSSVELVLGNEQHPKEEEQEYEPRHKTAYQMNQPDYPEWRDLLKQKKASILEVGDGLLAQQELDTALQQVYLLSKEFFGK